MSFSQFDFDLMDGPCMKEAIDEINGIISLAAANEAPLDVAGQSRLSYIVLSRCQISRAVCTLSINQNVVKI